MGGEGLQWGVVCLRRRSAGVSETKGCFMNGRSSENTRLISARRLHEKASKSGDYRDYERALHAFNMAASTGADQKETKKGLAAAQLGYAQEALINRDFDLALSLVDPLIGLNREAEALQKRILRKRLAHRLQRRRISFWALGLVLGAALVVVVVWNLIDYQRKSGESASGILVRAVDRGLGLRTGINIQVEYMAISTELSGLRSALARYESFTPALAFMREAYEVVMISRGGDPVAVREANTHLYEGVPLLRALQDDLAGDGDPKMRHHTRKLFLRLRGFIEALEDWRMNIDIEDAEDRRDAPE